MVMVICDYNKQCWKAGLVLSVTISVQYIKFIKVSAGGGYKVGDETSLFQQQN